VNAAIKKLETRTAGLRGQVLPPLAPDADLTICRLAEGVALDQQTLGHLDAELAWLTKVVDIATENARIYSRLTEKITTGEANLAKLKRSVELAEAADDKVKGLATQRTENYKKAVSAIIGEAAELASLYEPLGQQITGQPGAIGKLTFNVRRTVDAGRRRRGAKSCLTPARVGHSKARARCLRPSKRSCCLLGSLRTPGLAHESAECVTSPAHLPMKTSRS
jgi:hypothetical protein